MMSRTVMQPLDGTRKPKIDAPALREVISKHPKESSCATTGKSPKVVKMPLTANDINAQGVENQTMEPRCVLEQRRLQSNALTPYVPQAWSDLLVQTGLIVKYPSLPLQLHNGFVVGIPPLTSTYTPDNHSSLIEHHIAFNNNLLAKFNKGRYIGPFSKEEVLELIGPFQSSPLSIIPKPNKPGKYRFIQNFLHPYTQNGKTQSVNVAITSEDYPCTWGTFNTIALLIHHLPPGSEAATRDVKEAYRTVPLAPSQWPGMVVKLAKEDSYAIDTQNAFGLASGAGVYGQVADAGVDIMRAKGLGPISKWVDDHLFIRIRREHIPKYNEKRNELAHIRKKPSHDMVLYRHSRDHSTSATPPCL